MLDKKQSQLLRFRILYHLEMDKTDPASMVDEEDGRVCVDIDKRFVDQIFQDSLAMAAWCESWNIETQEFELPHVKHNLARSQWVRFKKIIK